MPAQLSAATGFDYLDRGLGPAGGVLAFAHRGGALHPDLGGLENTIKAFAHAVALGFDYLETDVHVTRDGVLLAFHDETLDRVTDAVGEIGRLDYAEVRRARIGSEEIPTFAQLVETFPDVRFNVDIKSEGAVSALARFIADHDLWDRVLVGSFSVRRTRLFRRLTGHRVPTAAHPLEIVAFRFLPSAALARRLAPGCAALQIPHRRGPLRVVTSGLVRRAHAAGLPVHVWTVDETEEMNELLDRGVDGIFTDRTDRLRSVLARRGQWCGRST